MEAPFITHLVMLLAASVAAVSLLRRLRLPSILAYLAVGLAVGPHALALVPDTQATRVAAEFGVVFLLFTLGLEFSITRMIAMRRAVFGLGGLQVLVTTLIGAGIAYMIGLEPGPSLVLGGAIAMSSTAIVGRQLSEQLELQAHHGHLAMGTLLFQDLAVVPFLILIPTLGVPGDVALWPLFGEVVLKAAGALAIVFIAGYWLLRPLLHQITALRSAELFTLTVLMLVISASWATHALGLSLALGAFLAGMMISETEFRHQVEADIRPFRDVLLGLFFITVGMLLDLGGILPYLHWIVLGALSLMAMKLLLITALARLLDDQWHASLRTGLVLAQGGEFGIALLTLALSSGVLPQDWGQATLATVVLSMLFSPLVIRVNGPLAKRVFADPEELEKEAMAKEMAVGSLPSTGHVIICGYGRVGQNVARFLEQEGFDFVALDMDPFRVRTAHAAGDPVHYGDATHQSVLEAAGLAQARCVVISVRELPNALRILEHVRDVNKEIPVLVRTQDDTDLDRLKEAGATEVVPEHLEASLMISSHLLSLLGVPVGRIVRRIQDARTHRYAILRNLFRAEDARPIGGEHAFREQLQNVALHPQAWAVGRSVAEVELEEMSVSLSALRRHGIVGREPQPDTIFEPGDVLVLYGTPEALSHAEKRLLKG